MTIMKEKRYEAEPIDLPEEYKNYLEVNLLTGFENLPLSYDEYAFILAYLQNKQ